MNRFESNIKRERTYYDQLDQQNKYINEQMQSISFDVKASREDTAKKINLAQADRQRNETDLQVIETELNDILRVLSNEDHLKAYGKAVEGKAKNAIQNRLSHVTKDNLRLGNQLELSKEEETDLAERLEEEKMLRQKGWELSIDTIEHEIFGLEALLTDLKRSDIEQIEGLEEKIHSVGESIQAHIERERKITRHEQETLSRLIEQTISNMLLL